MELPKNIQTNSELVEFLMNYSPYGAFSQMFIIESIRKNANIVADWSDETVKVYQDGCPGINIKAWRDQARYIKKIMDEFYTNTQ